MIFSPCTEFFTRMGRNVVYDALQLGPIPKHVAFIMDGNSRYASERRLEVVEGYNHGYHTLQMLLEHCFRSGIPRVTVYALGSDIFKHNTDEAATIINLAFTRLAHITLDSDILDRYGVRLAFLGDLSKLPKEAVSNITSCIENTKHNSKAFLNICVSYSAHDEITQAIRNISERPQHTSKPVPSSDPFLESRIVQSVCAQKLSQPSRFIQTSQLPSDSLSPPPTAELEDLLDEDSAVPSGTSTNSPATPASGMTASAIPQRSDITTELLNQNMLDNGAPSPDIIVRTGGGRSLSDFMLWQGNKKTRIVLTETLWPNYGFWDFLHLILDWQLTRQPRQSSR